VQEVNAQPVTQPTPAPWPTGVIARYANQAGALIDIRPLSTSTSFDAVCGGCPWDWTGAEYLTHQEAQAHSEKCRALQRPDVV